MSDHDSEHDATALPQGGPASEGEGEVLISIVIPHLNDHERLATCLDLLHRQTFPADRMEIIVVDNGSTRPVEELVARFPRARATAEAERGCGTARNRGVAEARGSILAFTDADCRPDPRWVENAVARMQAADAPDILAGEVEIFYAEADAPTDPELYERLFGFEQKRYAERKGFAAGANIVTTRAAFDRIGPFRNGRVPEDVEWGNRAVALGLRIAYAPDVLVRHPARREWKELLWKMDRTVFHQKNALAERRWFLARWLVLAAVLALPPVDKIAIILTDRRLTNGRQRARCLATVWRLRRYRVGRMLASLGAGDEFGRQFYSPQQ